MGGQHVGLFARRFDGQLGLRPLFGNRIDDIGRAGRVVQHGRQRLGGAVFALGQRRPARGGMADGHFFLPVRSKQSHGRERHQRQKTQHDDGAPNADPVRAKALPCQLPGTEAGLGQRRGLRYRGHTCSLAQLHAGIGQAIEQIAHQVKHHRGQRHVYRHGLDDREVATLHGQNNFAPHAWNPKKALQQKRAQ